jgi:hypothetical protein
MADGGQIIEGPAYAKGGKVDKDDGGAATGVFPQMKPKRSKQDREAAKNVPVDLARGVVSGVLGAPGDIESLLRIPYDYLRSPTMSELVTEDKTSKTLLPTSEDIEKRLPFRSEAPVSKAASGLGILGGGFYTGRGSPLRVIGALPSAIKHGAQEFAKASVAGVPHVVKPKGGNWMTGSVEKVLDPLIQKGIINNVNIPYGPEFDAAAMKRIAELKEAASQPDYKGGAGRVAEHLERDINNPRRANEAAVNKWIQSNLTNYVKKDMGTLDDPVRKLADEGISHLPLDTPMPRNMKEIRETRKEAGFPEPYGKSWQGLLYESLADKPIGFGTAGEMINRGKGEPWMKKADPFTQVYGISPMESVNFTQDLGFNHIVDVLRQDVASGRIRPEQLNKVSMEQAVRRTAEYDQEMAKKMAQAQAKVTEGMPTYKEYPEGYKWVQLAPPKELPSGYSAILDDVTSSYKVVDENGKEAFPRKPNNLGHINVPYFKTADEAIADALKRDPRLEDALKYEGETMGHCVGGYCDEVRDGKSKIYSLRDVKGEPHVTVEVNPVNKHRIGYGMSGGKNFPDDFRYESGSLAPEQHQQIYQRAKQLFNPESANDLSSHRMDVFQQAANEVIGKPADEIVQIKGKGNAKPKDDYLPFVQDFVQSGKWTDVGDLNNTGLLDIKNSMIPWPKGTQTEQVDRLLGGMIGGTKTPVYKSNEEFFSKAQQELGKRYITQAEYDNWLAKQINPDVPPIEGMAKGGKVKKIIKEGLDKLLGKADEAPKGVEPIIVRTPEERAVIEKFGQKQDQEAVRKKKVEKATKDAQESAGQSPEAQAAKPAKSKGPRVKVDADKYRKMAEEFGDEAVLKAVRAGEHLKPTATGYVGAPRTVTSPQGLGAMRRAMDADFADSVEAVRLADPTRLGTWYDRAKQGIAESTEPYQLNRALEQHGVYSAGVSPESELTFALKHLNSRVAGDPKVAYRGAGMRNLDNAVAEDRPANMGFKIGEYAKKNDPRIPNTGLFGVDDFRRAQGMGYTDPQGNPWKAGVSETMHPFMDAETALQVDRANTAGTGGRTDWHGPHIQELPWVYGKGQDLYSRGLRGRYKGDELEGIKMSLQDANNTARDYFYKQAASSTAEQIPGARLGHVSQALNMTPEEKLAYSLEGRFDMPVPEAALNEFPEVGAGNRDAIYSALGYRQLPTRQAEGYYQNSLGGVETNPMTISRPLMDFPTGGSGLMAPDSRRMMDAAEQFRALMDAQEAGAYNLPNTMGGVKGKNSLVLDTRGRVDDPLADPSAGVLPTSEQLAKMNELVGEQGFGVTASNRGAVMFPFDATMNPKEASKAMRKSSKGLEEIFPSSQEKSLSTMGYVPGVGKRSPEGPLSTAPYSGEATADLLKAFSELPPTVSQNLSESEAVRAAIRAKALRDSKMGGTRGDIQETRRFFSEADWPKAVALMRQGLTPAAALAALGYNINAMAADER